MISEILAQIESDLRQMDKEMERAERVKKALLDKVHPANSRSARNLLHYLTLRNHDIRTLQHGLHRAGLSSLASSESHIRGQLQAILERLNSQFKASTNIFDSETGKAALLQNVRQLFGERADSGIPYIMITLDGAYADDYASIKNLLRSGMNVARINCAHDDPDTWLKMIRLVRKAARVTGLSCKIYMDLAGPKIRTVVKGKDPLDIAVGKKIYLCDETHLAFSSSKKNLGCTVESIEQQVKEGDKVLIDDGLIEARVEQVESRRVALKIMRISSKKPRIKSEKGINFPDSDLKVSALTNFDRSCLPFIQEHADMVGYSFVRHPDDVDELKAAMGAGRRPSIILKIETLEAVRNLPDLLFEGLEEEQTGVMIARGDLAVEIGFERLSEIQEEILWICEAAHVPVIWATQVLDTLNKSGLATRSEITDAAHAAHADCVMINKGDYIFRVIETLKDVLTRSGGHHEKKRYTFRPLAIAGRFFEKG